MSETGTMAQPTNEVLERCEQPPMTTLEKVARAIYVAYFARQHPGLKTRDWDGLSEHAKALWAVLARAALSALLPPTEEMVEAMVEHFVDDYPAMIRAETRAAFTAAINKIVEERG